MVTSDPSSGRVTDRARRWQSARSIWLRPIVHVSTIILRVTPDPRHALAHERQRPAPGVGAAVDFRHMRAREHATELLAGVS